MSATAPFKAPPHYEQYRHKFEIKDKEIAELSAQVDLKEIELRSTRTELKAARRALRRVLTAGLSHSSSIGPTLQGRNRESHEGEGGGGNVGRHVRNRESHACYRMIVFFRRLLICGCL